MVDETKSQPVPTIAPTAENFQTRKNSLEPHQDNLFGVLPEFSKWQAVNHQTPELALGSSAFSPSIEQTLHITDDRSDIEVSLQDCEVQTVDRHR